MECTRILLISMEENHARIFVENYAKESALISTLPFFFAGISNRERVAHNRILGARACDLHLSRGN